MSQSVTRYDVTVNYGNSNQMTNSRDKTYENAVNVKDWSVDNSFLFVQLNAHESTIIPKRKIVKIVEKYVEVE